eukprot:1130303_1
MLLNQYRRLLSKCVSCRKFCAISSQSPFDNFRPKDLLLKRLTGSDKGIVEICLNRPKVNALSRNLLAELGTTIDILRVDNSARVVILKSSLERIFCAGADLKERISMFQPEVDSLVHKLRSTFTDFQRLPMPTIAVIDGAALGGGMELALACDFRVAGDGATIGFPETALAIIPGAGGTQRLPRLIGATRAKELIFCARRVNSAEAARLGVVDYAACGGRGAAEEKALSLAREILPQGPIALKMAKIAIDRGMDVDLDSGFNLEKQCYAQIIPTEDRLEGLRAFKEKRKPAYSGKKK